MARPIADDGALAGRLEQESQRLRAIAPAVQAMGIDARINGLERLARRWMHPEDPFRQRAVAALPAECALAAEQVVWGIEQAFGAIDGQSLRAWWDREGGPTTASLSGHMWSGNVFVAGLPPVLASLLAGLPALIKSPSSQPTFASLLVASLVDCEPGLGQGLAAESWPRTYQIATDAFLGACDVVFAFGADESIDSVRRAMGEQGTFCGFGHRYSIGVALGEGCDDNVAVESGADSASLEGLVRDHLVWDGQGCLTPRWVFVEGDMERAQTLARRAADVLPSLARQFPGQPLTPEAGSARAAWLASTAFACWSAGGSGWAVAAVPWGDVLPASPPPRCLCFASVPDLGRLPELLAPLGSRLQGLCRLGPASRDDELRALFAPLGLSRLAKAGGLQQPPVDWNHDDVRILASLCSH